MEKANFLKVIGIFFIFVATLVSGTFFLSSLIMKTNYHIEDSYDNFISADGYIVDIIEPQYEGNYPRAVYRFYDKNGNEYNATTYSSIMEDFEIGDKIEVYYDKDDPLNSTALYFINRYNTMTTIYLIICILTFIPGVITLLIGIIMGKKNKKKVPLQNN